MLTNYLKIAFRNLQRNKMRSLIHILGLSLGIAACFLIFNVLSHSYSFDRFHPDVDRIFRINTVTDWGEGGYFPNSGTPGPLGEVIQDEVSGIQAKGRLYTLYETMVLDPEKNKSFGRSNRVTYADQGFMEIFPRTWLAGNSQSALVKPFSAVITRTSLEKYFPGFSPEQALGKELLFVDSDTVSTQITGVVEDYVQNSDFIFEDFISYASIQTEEQKEWFGLHLWGSVNSSSQLFIKANEGVDEEILAERFKPLVAKYFAEETEYETAFWAEPVTEMHFSQNYANDQVSKVFLNGLVLIGIIILLLASLNFINLETAQAVNRAKEVGIRKTIGGGRGELITQFLTETLVIVVLSTWIGILCAEGMQLMFGSYLPTDFRIEYTSLWNILFYFAFPILVTGLTGLYPALLLSNYKAQRALKGEVAKGYGFSWGTFLRKNLTVLQFASSMTFIILVLVLNAQLRYVSSQPMGFDQEQVLYASLPFMSDPDQMLQLQSRLNQESSVLSSSLSGSLVSSTSLWTSDAYIPVDTTEQQLFIQVMNIDSAFVRTNGIPLLAGSAAIREEDELIVNENFLKEAGIENPEAALGLSIRHSDQAFRIIGVVSNFHSRSLKEEIKPMIMKTNREYFQTISVKLQAGQNLAIAKENLEEIYRTVYPYEEVSFEFLDSQIDRFYAEDSKIRNVLGFACALAILISCMGLFGLSSFTIAQRTKEISIRKVLGASLQEILLLISREYMILVGLSFVLAVFPAYYFLNSWLAGFYNRIDMPYLIFLAAGLGVLVLCLLIVGIHSYGASQGNPAKVLKSE
ncbi:ABC transporter permease [Algoriphagus namhaensis]